MLKAHHYRITRLLGLQVYRIEVEKRCFFGGGMRWVPFKERRYYYDGSSDASSVEYPSFEHAQKRLDQIRDDDYERAMRYLDTWTEVRS